jgi:hypothetical protein
MQELFVFFDTDGVCIAALSARRGARLDGIAVYSDAHIEPLRARIRVREDFQPIGMNRESLREFLTEEIGGHSHITYV